MNIDEKDLKNRFEAHGLKPTPLRLQIMSILMNHKNHLSSTEIIEAIRENGTEPVLSTVYQNIKTLVKHDLIWEFRGADNVVRYDANPVKHEHIICGGCGRIMDISLGKVIDPNTVPVDFHTRKPLKGWRIDVVNYQITGICPECTKKKKE